MAAVTTFFIPDGNLTFIVDPKVLSGLDSKTSMSKKEIEGTKFGATLKVPKNKIQDLSGFVLHPLVVQTLEHFYTSINSNAPKTVAEVVPITNTQVLAPQPPPQPLITQEEVSYLKQPVSQVEKNVSTTSKSESQKLLRKAEADIKKADLTPKKSDPGYVAKPIPPEAEPERKRVKFLESVRDQVDQVLKEDALFSAEPDTMKIVKLMYSLFFNDDFIQTFFQ